LWPVRSSVARPSWLSMAISCRGIAGPPGDHRGRRRRSRRPGCDDYDGKRSAYGAPRGSASGSQFQVLVLFGTKSARSSGRLRDDPEFHSPTQRTRVVPSGLFAKVNKIHAIRLGWQPDDPRLGLWDRPSAWLREGSSALLEDGPGRGPAEIPATGPRFRSECGGYVRPTRRCRTVLSTVIASVCRTPAGAVRRSQEAGM